MRPAGGEDAVAMRAQGARMGARQAGALGSGQRVLLTQRPVRGVRAVVEVPFVAPGPVERAGPEAAMWNGSEQTSAPGRRRGWTSVLAADPGRERPDRFAAGSRSLENWGLAGAAGLRR